MPKLWMLLQLCRCLSNMAAPSYTHKYAGLLYMCTQYTACLYEDAELLNFYIFILHVTSSSQRGSYKPAAVSPNHCDHAGPLTELYHSANVTLQESPDRSHKALWD
ncbi:hypothetical protein GDO86_019231 [Hymenochirus boettgeri]|uniref:Secreted protein n=1 Tax=Hymenochirus boettgeri TaxID=247094 RepID=A0A8T2IHS1_9PIPI|nr:hypothetical protein GDO86_019231 [Hymenochirus boettgeri]